ncbi:hypothetical protein [Marinicella sp. W31]|uniref:hypothetical protein n=1 Tax=Marinicella sp. W31 TaxID=3023713 RepID=UPI003756E143
MKSLFLTSLILSMLLLYGNAFAAEPEPIDAFSEGLMEQLHQLQLPYYTGHSTVTVINETTFEYSHATEYILSRYRIDTLNGKLNIYREDRGHPHSNKEYYFKPFSLSLQHSQIGIKPIDLKNIEVRAGCGGALAVLTNLMDSLEDAMEGGSDSSSSYIEDLVRAVTRALHDFLSCMLH